MLPVHKQITIMCATVKASEQRQSSDWRMFEDGEDCAISFPGKHNDEYRQYLAGFLNKKV